MTSDRQAAGARRVLVFALLALLIFVPTGAVSTPQGPRLVVVLYPDSNDGRPGGILFDQGFRSTFPTGASPVFEIHSEYLDVSRSSDSGYQQNLADFLRKKYAGRKVDLVVAGLASALNFAIKHRQEIFPGVPIVFSAVDEREVKTAKLPPDVIGFPIKMDLAATLDLALHLHPHTKQVYVIAGKAKFDLYWEAEARQTFQEYEDRVEFIYLTGLPIEDLLKRVKELPDQSIIYYLHIFQDGNGKTLIPAEVLEQLAKVANTPIFGHVDSYIGRGLVGGRVFSFATAGKNAAKLGLRILAGEKPEQIGIQETTENSYIFDWPQLSRWGIGEEKLPPGSEVRFKNPNFWDLYRWHILGVLSLCVIETLLIVGLLVQRANRRKSEERLRVSQRELQVLTGRLLQAQETERRRIARELHDDLNQNLALLSVELDLLGQKSPETAPQFREHLQEVSTQIKQLSSTVHALSHQLHPSRLAQLGLVATVRGLCMELALGHGLSIDFTHEDVPETIPEEAALCLFRIVQEALGNVIKHSGAKHVRLELKGNSAGLYLRVIDDGAGFDPRMIDGKEGNGGLGLVSMRERLYLIRGEIIIDSRPGEGTRIDVRVPLENQPGGKSLGLTKSEK